MLRLQDVVAILACIGTIIISIICLVGGEGALFDVSLITYSFNESATSSGGYIVHFYRIFYLQICRGTWDITETGTILSQTDTYCASQVGGFHLRFGDSILKPDAFNSFWTNYQSNVGKSMINTLGPFIALLLGMLFALATFVILVAYLMRARRDTRAYIIIPALASTICMAVETGWLYDLRGEPPSQPFFWDAPSNPTLLSKLATVSVGLMGLVVICQISLPWGTPGAYRKNTKTGEPVQQGDEYMMDNEGLTQVTHDKQRVNLWVKEDNALGEEGKRREAARVQTPESARDQSSVWTRGSLLVTGESASEKPDRPDSVASVSTAKGRVRESALQHPLAQTATIEVTPATVDNTHASSNEKDVGKAI